MNATSQTQIAPDSEIRILHVDDEPDFARMVAGNLERENDRFSVQWTTDPAAVAEIVATEAVDCILSDYAMPELTGLDVLGEIRAVDPEIPFILFTDTGSETIASEAISAGVSDYVIKKTVKKQYTLLASKITTHVERRRAEAVASRTQQQLRELTENTNDVLFIFSADWSELKYINSRYEDLFGRSVAALRENPTAFLDAVHPDDVDDLETAMGRAADGSSQQVEYRIQADSEKWVESHAEPIRDETGTVVRVAGFTHEITERKRRELELRAKNERLERFASIVSHDLRNPLSVADGYLELAREEADSDHLETAARALDRMETLISDLLTLAREGQEVTESKSVSLDKLVLSSWNNIDQQNATLHTETNANILADEIRLGQVFENLFRNAVEHGSTGNQNSASSGDATEHGGDAVSITVDLLEDGTGFYVENDGTPIPEDKRDQIFETGFTTNEEGTGFGLAIIKRIVNAHGWEIDLADSQQGGVRFEITGTELTDKTNTPDQN